MTQGVQDILAEALAGRYSVDRELARGGMATVYLGRDIEQGRAVAIKVMHPKLATVLGAERFLREIKIAGSMDHPLIVPLYDSGNVGEVLYYVMPYVEGETLHQRLERERRLRSTTRCGLRTTWPRRLGYAHGRRVLHRDVKPENILLADGRALVADFGLARAIGAADYRKLTETGIILGTAYYMSPEQLREDASPRPAGGCLQPGVHAVRDADGRTALHGTVAHGGGHPDPSRADSSIQRLQPDVPAEVDQVVSRALAKSAAERFATHGGVRGRAATAALISFPVGVSASEAPQSDAWAARSIFYRPRETDRACDTSASLSLLPLYHRFSLPRNPPSISVPWHRPSP